MVRIETVLRILAWLATLLCASALFPRMDPAPRLLFAGATAVGLLFESRGKHPLPEKGFPFIFLGLLLFQVARFSLFPSIRWITELLFLLLGLLLMAEKTGRNSRRIFLFALLSQASFFLQDPEGFRVLSFLPLLALVFAGLVLSTFQNADPGLDFGGKNFRFLSGITLGLPALSLLLMAVLFPFLPRTPHPLWNFDHAEFHGFPLPAEKVIPGERPEREMASRIVFRVVTKRVLRENLYWRRIVLNTPEGDAWIRNPPPGSERAETLEVPSLEQTVFGGRGSGRFLPALDIPLHCDLPAAATEDRIFALDSNPEAPFRYRVISRPEARLKGRDIPREFYLRTPEGVSPRVKGAAARLAARSERDEEKIALLCRYFRGLGLSYSREGNFATDAPVDTFLFSRKEGYCEHFAASFALMLRLMGVPVRLVGGYLGGEYNVLGGYYALSTDTAHVWTEVFVNGAWERIDPTLLARNAETVISGGGRISLFSRILDAADFFLIRTGIAWGLDGREHLPGKDSANASEIFSSGRSGSMFIAAAIGISGGLLLLVRRKRRSPEERLLRRFLLRAGRKTLWTPPGTTTGLLDLRRETDDPICQEFIEIYAGAVYRDRKLSRNEKNRLRRLIRRLRRPLF